MWVTLENAVTLPESRRNDTQKKNLEDVFPMINDVISVSCFKSLWCFVNVYDRS